MNVLLISQALLADTAFPISNEVDAKYLKGKKKKKKKLQKCKNFSKNNLNRRFNSFLIPIYNTGSFLLVLILFSL